MSIYKTQDIHIDDINLKTNYYRKFINGDIDGAKEIYELNPSLQGKCLNAELLNQLLDEILNLENEFNTNVTEFLSNQLNKYQININDLLYMQEWDASVAYVVNNFVSQNGYIYFCYTEPPIGTEPTDTDYWIELNTQGRQGYVGLGINYLGQWGGSTAYKAKDMVVYQNELYIARSDNTNVLPTNSTYWYKGITVDSRIIFVSDTEPDNIIVGDIWFKIL